MISNRALKHESKSGVAAEANSDAKRETPHGAGRSSFDLIDRHALFEALDLRKGSSFLDIACGRGAYTLAASELIGPEGTLYAVDLWEEGLTELSAEAHARGIRNLIVKVADVGKKIPIAGRSVDAALIATVLHDLVEEGIAQNALRETARVLRPGGTLAVVEFKKTDGPPGPPRAVRLDAGEVQSLAEPFGFECGKVTDLGLHHYLLVFRLRKPPA
jgi:ubiquinone/menaquinone biosynthesis C-methylase UbiE